MDHAFQERFSDYVCVGDTISTESDGLTITARIVADDCPDAPDERQEGFWPSLVKDAPGFIGPGKKFRQRFDKAQARAEMVMQGWRDGDWFYCGIVLAVIVSDQDGDDIVLDNHAASLWGVEANYPDTDNAYLTETANELLLEALIAARAALARVRKADPASAPSA
ncbi:MAG: hypothetical protein AAFR28_05200 [Pseudomonadota bacterium]